MAFANEYLGHCKVAGAKVDDVPGAIDRPVELNPFAMDLGVSPVQTPRTSRWLREPEATSGECSGRPGGLALRHGTMPSGARSAVSLIERWSQNQFRQEPAHLQARPYILTFLPCSPS
jgi:hypothetical protein